MKIVEIRGYRLEAKMSAPVRNAVSTIDTRTALVVELVTDDGRSGWGETQRAPATVWSFIETSLAGRVLGRSPFDGNAIWQGVHSAGLRGEVVRMAAGAIDIALWDLRGRVTGRSIADLLGGRLRDRVRAYASGPFMAFGDDPYRQVLDEAAGYLKQGFTALKIRAGHTPRADAEIMAALRRALGPDVGLAMDINQGYGRAAAAEVARLVEPLGLWWIEEPLEPFDIDGYTELSALARCPVAAGESLTELRDFREFLARRAVSVIQPDLYLAGGFTGTSKVAAVAEAYGIPVLPHVFGSFINFYASLQLAAVLPETRLGDDLRYPVFEYDRGDNPLRAVPADPALGADGALAIPDGPGLGIEVRRDDFAAHVRQAWRLAL